MTFHGQDDTQAELSRIFIYAPCHRLVQAGRGAIFRSIEQIGHAMCYDVQLLSPDTEDLAAIGHLASTAPTHLTTPDTVHELDMFDAHSAFLTLFHDHDWKPWLLCTALKTSARFIGSLGSRRAHDLRRESLRQLDIPEESLARLRGPIGLLPSLRDASSTSVSAMAEIVAAF
nr:XdhC family protein [Thalassovita aquimarina]